MKISTSPFVMLAAIVIVFSGFLSDTVAQSQTPKASGVPADTKQRLALVIGNGSYKQAPLGNPVNDARAISQALRESGFVVITHENADLLTMLAALREFGDRLRAGGTGLFYFAGHGMQIKGRNYLAPVDAAFDREDEVAYRTVDAQAVLDKMEVAGNGANIMILDACRTNPFPRSSRAAQQGLAQMDAPVGTLIAYATSPGMVASDGRGANGLYTHHLLNAIRQDGSKVEDVFKQVRGNVRRDSGGTQVPWEATSLEGDFYFKGGPTAPQRASSGDALDLALWDMVKNSTVPIEIAAYLNRYPNGTFSLDARKRLSELGAGAMITGQGSSMAPAVGSSTGSSSPRPERSSNEAGYFSGDRWRFQVVDKFKGEVVRNYSNTVDTILSDGSMVLNGGSARWDANGNLRALNEGDSEDTYIGYVFNPPKLESGARTPLNYSIQRKSEKGVTTDIGRGSMVVRGQEKVITPAGRFDAWRVEIEVYGSTQMGQGVLDYRVHQGGPNAWRLAVTGWYVPELRSYVAYEEEMRVSTGMQNSSAGTFSQRERHELTSFSVRGAENLARR